MASTDKTIIREIGSSAYHDPVYFCQTFLPHIFEEPLPWIHRGLLYYLLGKGNTEFGSCLLNDPEKEIIIEHFVDQKGEPVFHRGYNEPASKVLIMLPGGFAKTTFAGLVLPLYFTLYHETGFLAYVGSTPGDGRSQVENVRNELEGNERITAVFGQNKGDKWTGNAITTASGIAMSSRGYGHQETIEKVRGMTHAGKKPGILIADGLTTRSNSVTDKQRQEVQGWFYSEVIPAVSAQGRLIYFDTLKHADSLPEHIANDPAWTVIRLSSLDKRGVATWPLVATEAAIAAQRKSYAMGNQLHIFNMEYFNEPTAEDSTGLLAEMELERNEFLSLVEPYADTAFKSFVESRAAEMRDIE